MGQRICRARSDRFLLRLDRLCHIGLDQKVSLCGLPIRRMHLASVNGENAGI
jgi:hypothetical protein